PRPTNAAPVPYTTLFRSAERAGIEDVAGMGHLQPAGCGRDDVASVDGHDGICSEECGYVPGESLRGHGRRIIVCLRLELPLLLRSEEHTSELQSRENLVC